MILHYHHYKRVVGLNSRELQDTASPFEEDCTEMKKSSGGVPLVTACPSLQNCGCRARSGSGPGCLQTAPSIIVTAASPSTCDRTSMLPASQAGTCPLSIVRTSHLQKSIAKRGFLHDKSYNMQQMKKQTLRLFLQKISIQIPSNMQQTALSHGRPGGQGDSKGGPSTTMTP